MSKSQHSGSKSGGSGAKSGVQAHDLCLESEVHRGGCERGTEAKQLRDENTKAEKTGGDLCPDKEMLKAVIGKPMGPSADTTVDDALRQRAGTGSRHFLA